MGLDVSTSVLLRLFVFGSLVVSSLSGGLPQDIYHVIPVPDGSACFRLMNGTHQFGCHSSAADGEGVVIVVKTVDELKDVKSCWRQRFEDYNGGFFVLIDISLLDRAMTTALRDSSCVRGLLLTDQVSVTLSTPTIVASHDSQCPNDGSSFYRDGCAKNSWNAKWATLPEGLQNIDWRKQIVFMDNETHISDIQKCHQLFNIPSAGSTSVSYPFCAASFALRSSAAGNSEICHRRSQTGANVLDAFLNFEGTPMKCNPLSGKSIIGLIPPNGYKADREKAKHDQYMLLTSRLDSFGLVPHVSPGDISVFTSFIAMMATAKSIGVNYDVFEAAANASGHYLIYALFNGESFDYIGSSHLMYTIETETFPMTNPHKLSYRPEMVSSSQIMSVIEAQQLGTGSKLHAIVDGDQLKKMSSKVNTIVQSLADGASGAGGSVVDPMPGGRIPPSAWHSVAKVNPDAVGVVLAPFTTEYGYGRVNSMRDHNNWTSSVVRDSVEAQIVVAAAAMLRAAATHVGVGQAAMNNMTIDKALVSKLFDCLVIRDNMLSCPFFKGLNITVHNQGSYTGKDSYIGVNTGFLQHIAADLCILFAGSTAHTGNVKDANTCNDLGKNELYNYHWLTDLSTGKKHCYRHNIYSDELTSPAFLIKGYDFKNTTYSTWTESVYQLDDLKLYLVQKSSFEWYMLAIGGVLALLSVLFVGRCSEHTFVIDEGEPLAEQGEPL